MKLFVYEFITGGGTWGTAGTIDPAGSLLAEGKAMAEAVVADFAAAGMEVLAMLDVRLEGRVSLAGHIERIGDARQEREMFRKLARTADATLLIAPEVGGLLLARCRWVEEDGGRLVSPGSQFVALAADKHLMAERWSARKVRTPRGKRLRGPLDAADWDLFPAVVKPCDGAGSWLVRRVENPHQLQSMLRSPDYQQAMSQAGLRLERLVSGMAASVAVLCGPAGPVLLAPCEQRLGGGTGFEYQGGRLPLALTLAERARRLVAAAVDALPETVGYIGLDIILGAAADGSEDYAIEVNPRLTTSYVGLKRACRENLAAAMLAVAAGESPALSFADDPVEFRADGTLQDPFGCTA